jgi:hypothetical protein
LSYLDEREIMLAGGARVERELVIGAGATLERGAELSRAIVWDGEQVPASLKASDGVFAGGCFHPIDRDRAEGRGAQG